MLEKYVPAAAAAEPGCEQSGELRSVGSVKLERLVGAERHFTKGNIERQLAELLWIPFATNLCSTKNIAQAARVSPHVLTRPDGWLVVS